MERCVGEVRCAAEVALNGDAGTTEIDQRVSQDNGVEIRDAPGVRDGNLVVDGLAGLEGAALARSLVRDALLDGVLRRLGLPDREEDVVSCSQRIVVARSIISEGAVLAGAPAEELMPLPIGNLARHYDLRARLASGGIDGAGGTVQIVRQLIIRGTLNNLQWNDLVAYHFIIVVTYLMNKVRRSPRNATDGILGVVGRLIGYAHAVVSEVPPMPRFVACCAGIANLTVGSNYCRRENCRIGKHFFKLLERLPFEKRGVDLSIQSSLFSHLIYRQLFFR